MLVQKLLKNKALFRLLFWIWLIAVFIFSSIPNLDVPDKEIANLIRSDYLIHFFQYLILGFFFVIWQQIKIKDYKNLLIGIIAGFIIGSVDEFHQVFIPGRAFNFIDLFLNISGFIVGLFISAYILLIIFRSIKA